MKPEDPKGPADAEERQAKVVRLPRRWSGPNGGGGQLIELHPVAGAPAPGPRAGSGGARSGPAGSGTPDPLAPRSDGEKARSFIELLGEDELVPVGPSDAQTSTPAGPADFWSGSSALLHHTPQVHPAPPLDVGSDRRGSAEPEEGSGESAHRLPLRPSFVVRLDLVAVVVCLVIVIMGATAITRGAGPLLASERGASTGLPLVAASITPGGASLALAPARVNAQVKRPRRRATRTRHVIRVGHRAGSPAARRTGGQASSGSAQRTGTAAATAVSYSAVNRPAVTAVQYETSASRTPTATPAASSRASGSSRTGSSHRSTAKPGPVGPGAAIAPGTAG